MSTRSKANKELVNQIYTDAIDPNKKQPKIPLEVNTPEQSSESDSSTNFDSDDTLNESSSLNNTIVNSTLNETDFLNNIVVNSTPVKLKDGKPVPKLDPKPVPKPDPKPAPKPVIPKINIMALGNNHTISLRDALEVIPYYDGSNIPYSRFAKCCKEAKAMLPAEAEPNLVKIIRPRLLGEAHRAVEDRVHDKIDDLLSYLKEMFANTRSYCQLQGELGNMYQRKSEGVVSYANRIKDLGQQITESYKANNSGSIDNTTKTNIEKEMLRCFVNGLSPEIEQRLPGYSNVEDTIKGAIAIEKRLSEILSVRHKENNYNSNNREKYILDIEKCQICLQSGHAATNCENRYQQTNGIARNNLGYEIMICHICNKRGHDASRCRMRELPRINNRGVRYVREDPIRCQICQGIGHSADRCLRTDRSKNFTNREPQTCQLCHQFGHTADRCRRTQPSVTCQICKKSGHSAEKCWQNRGSNPVSQILTCQICKRTGHSAEKCWQSKGNYSNPQSLTCQICRRTGHSAETCTHRNQTSSLNSQNALTCRYCRETGHLIDNCIKRERAGQRSIEQGNGVGRTENGVRRETSVTAQPLATGIRNRN